MKTQLIILLTLISMLLACGNEETPPEVETQEQAPDQTTNTAAETESPEQTEDEPATTQEEPAEQAAPSESPSLPIIHTSDLVSNTEFSFNSNANLQLKLPASPSSTMNYFINVCSDFSDESGIQKINYDSCQLRTLLKAEEQEFSLSLSNAETVLIAQIWPIKADSQPITFYYNIQDDGESWHITLP
jgi:hypothetical protein